MLLPEEKMIMYCLSQYESILMDQAIRFLYHKPNQTAQKIIRGLRKQHRLILGQHKDTLVCLPKDTRLNKHTAIFGASGTMKSRAVIRNAIFQAIKRGESVLVSDPKSELYSDTSELFRKNGYEVKVFNLVDPKHADTWNCMSVIADDTLMAQVLTNVIIGNTSKGKGDHFWDNGETNLLKALVLYIALDDHRTPGQKKLWEVYQPEFSWGWAAGCRCCRIKRSSDSFPEAALI